MFKKIGRWAKTVFPAYAPWIPGGGGGSKASTTTQTSNYTPAQMDLQKQMIDSYAPHMNQYNDVVNRLIRGDSRAEANEYFNTAIANPARRQFQDQTMPALNKSFARNYWSSGRTNAINKAQTDMENNLAQAQSKFLYDTAQADKNTALNALKYSPNETLLRLLGNEPMDTVVTPEQKKGLLTGLFDLLGI